MLGSPQFPQFLQDFLAHHPNGLVVEPVGCEATEGSTTKGSGTQPMGISCALTPSRPHTARAPAIHKHSPILLKTTARALYLQFHMPAGVAVGNLALGKNLECLEGRNSSLCKQEHQESREVTHVLWGLKLSSIQRTAFILTLK